MHPSKFRQYFLSAKIKEMTTMWCIHPSASFYLYLAVTNIAVSNSNFFKLKQTISTKKGFEIVFVASKPVSSYIVVKTHHGFTLNSVLKQDT